MMNLEQFAQLKRKKTHAYLDYCNSTCTVVAWIFRTERLAEFPAHRQCCPHSACYCRHSHHFEIVGDCVNPQFVRRQGVVKDRLPPHAQ